VEDVVELRARNDDEALYSLVVDFALFFLLLLAKLQGSDVTDFKFPTNYGADVQIYVIPFR